MAKETNKVTGYPSIDKPWLKYYSESDLQMEVPECTVYKNIYNPHAIKLKRDNLTHFIKMQDKSQ